MGAASETFEKLVRLDICAEIEPEGGCSRALLNLLNGMIIQLPKPSGFTMWGNTSVLPRNADCLVVGHLPQKGEANTRVAFLANEDLRAIERVWSAQAAMQAGRKL